MPDEATGTEHVASRASERIRDDARRVYLVIGVALASLAVLALAWTSTPASTASAAAPILAIGAIAILTLTVLGLAAAHWRAHEHLRVHNEALDAVHDALEWHDEGPQGNLGERVADLEQRLERVETVQNEHLVELVDTTDPPEAGAPVETGS